MQWTHWHPHNSSAARLIKWLTKSTATVRIYRVAQEIVEHLCLTLKYAQFYFVYTPCLTSTVNRLNIHEFFCNFADNIVTRPKYFLCDTIHDVFKNTFTSNKNFLHCTLTNLQKKSKPSYTLDCATRPCQVLPHGESVYTVMWNLCCHLVSNFELHLICVACATWPIVGKMLSSTKPEVIAMPPVDD